MGPGPNSEQIRKIGPEWAPEMRQHIGNPYQMEHNKAAPSAPPKGAACLLFGKDFLRLASFPEPVLGRFSEFVPNLDRDPSRI